MIPSIVATLAPLFSCIQLLPQVYKTYITKSAEDLSYYSLICLVVTTLLWTLHGYFIKDAALFIAGIISLFINFSLFWLYIKYSSVYSSHMYGTLSKLSKLS